MTKQQYVLLRDKAEFTRFQILFEVLQNQPHVRQKDISDKLGITIQAVSKYLKRLSQEGYLEIGSERADYRLTSKGIAKLRESVRSMESYFKAVKNELKIDHAWIALATYSVKAGEQVGLITKEGIFYTVPVNDPNSEAAGIAIADANPGEDLGLKNLTGRVKLKQGQILIVKLPSIHKGGSRAVDLVKVRAFYEEFKPDRVGVMGAVGRAVLNKLGLKADFEFGIAHSAAVAASRGLNVLVLVVGRMVNRMIQEIDSQNLKFASDILYEVKDAQLTKIAESI
ncbi:MAG: winged helix-turn-helix transcriptional regulator [Candidatus Bathyarchaeota archaeon]|nr:winged helix-turn-helix transcriptional regulator [Candidatus Bathyarchaeota archaeon]